MAPADLQANRLLQTNGGNQCDHQRKSEQEKHVAKSEDEGLLLHDLADGNDGAMRGFDVIGHAAADEILGQLLQLVRVACSNIDTESISTPE